MKKKATKKVRTVLRNAGDGKFLSKKKADKLPKNTYVKESVK